MDYLSWGTLVIGPTVVCTINSFISMLPIEKNVSVDFNVHILVNSFLLINICLVWVAYTFPRIDKNTSTLWIPFIVSITSTGIIIVCFIMMFIMGQRPVWRFTIHIFIAMYILFISVFRILDNYSCTYVGIESTENSQSGTLHKEETELNNYFEIAERSLEEP